MNIGLYESTRPTCGAMTIYIADLQDIIDAQLSIGSGAHCSIKPVSQYWNIPKGAWQSGSDKDWYIAKAIVYLEKGE